MQITTSCHPESMTSFKYSFYSFMTPCMAQTVKRLPTMWKTWVQSLGQEDPLEREQQPTAVFSPGEFHEQRSLVGSSPWNRTESDMTELLSLTHTHM